MTSATPGPWVPLFGEHPNPAILGPNGKAIAHAVQRDDWKPGDGITRETAEANARMMAAAPALLAAALEFMDGRQTARDMFIAAIAAATGQ